MIVRHYLENGQVRPATRKEIFSQHLSHLRFKLFGEFRFLYWLLALALPLYTLGATVIFHFIHKFW